MRRQTTVLGLLPLLAGSVFGQQGESPDAELSASLERARAMAPLVTIVRDEYGVPHVSATTDAGAIFGGLYARAEDEMSHVEDSHAKMMGRASMLPGAAGIGWDKLVLLYEVPELAKAQCAAAPPEVRALTRAAADALNYYVSRHPEYHPRAIPCWEPWMFFAHEYGTPLYQVQQEYTHLLANLAKQPATEQPPAPAKTPAEPAPIPALPAKASDGSNAWAIAGSRTASGRAMLYINPHIPIDQPYEIEMRSDEGLHITGMVAYGGGMLPMLGFNDHLGWSLTVNYPKITDAYAIKFDVPGDFLAYHHGDQILHATRWKTKISVLQGTGAEARQVEQELEMFKTIQGPLVYEANGVDYVIRVSGTENLRAIEQVYGMCRARNMEEWRQAVSLFGIVFHNLVYADEKGNIGYIYAGAFPKRDPAVMGQPILDGSDPRTDWLGYRTLEELPQVWNPKAGYVLSCNSPPTRTTGEGENPEASKFPQDMIGDDLVDGRVKMSHAILSAADKWTLDDLERAAFDSKVYALESYRPGLLADFAKLTDPVLKARIAPAVELVKSWDGRLALDSVASTVFMIWVEKLFSAEWKARRQPGDICAALNEVLNELQRDFKTWEVKWGEVNRHQRFDSNASLAVSDERDSIPIIGGHGSMGVSFCYLTRASGTRRRYGYHGASYVGAVEFGEKPAARSIIPFGESRDPASPHYQDQMALYAGGHFKPVHFTPDEVKAAARRTYHPGE